MPAIAILDQQARVRHDAGQRTTDTPDWPGRQVRRPASHQSASNRRAQTSKPAHSTHATLAESATTVSTPSRAMAAAPAEKH